MATGLSKNTPKIPATEICILVIVYIIPFLNRLNLLSKFPVLKYAMPLLGFYQSTPTLGLISFLALFIGLVRYKNFTKFNYSLQAIIMDSAVVIASLVRPFLVNPDPSSARAFGFKFQLLNVLELLGFQTCIHSCSDYLGAVQGVGKEEKANKEEGEKVNETSDVSCPSIDALTHIMELILKTYGYEGRYQAQSLVWKLLGENNRLLSDVNSAKTFNKYLLSSSRSCLNSLLNLFKPSQSLFYTSRDVDRKISLEARNLLWLLDVLRNSQAAEEFAFMWANQQKLANLHVKSRARDRELISLITTRLLVGIGNGEILPEKETLQLLLLTWFQPLLDDYSSLRQYESFDPKVVEENIERAILELMPEDQKSILLTWYGCFLKDGDSYPDLLKAFEGWCRRGVHPMVI